MEESARLQRRSAHRRTGFCAVQQFAFGQRGRPRFKGINRPLHSLEATTNAANIIGKKETGCVVLGDLTLPVLLPSAAQDPYLHQALTSKTKYCRVLWRNVNGERRWFVQLLQTDLAPAKHAVAAGAVVGLDIGPSTIAVVGTTQTCAKKPLSQHWHSLGDGSGVVQRDIYSAFLARCVMNNAHHPSPIEALWAAQKPVLLQTGWLCHEPAKIEPSGKITVLAPSEQVVCNRRRALGHGQDAVAETQVLGDSDGFAFRTPRL
jgi:hypothetical protein